MKFFECEYDAEKFLFGGAVILFGFVECTTLEGNEVVFVVDDLIEYSANSNVGSIGGNA